MRRVLKCSIAFLCAAVMFTPRANAQDSPSLGDVARQSRQQKQQKDAQGDKDAPPNPKDSVATQAKDATTHGKDVTSSGQAKDTAAKDAQPAKTAKRVITNDDIPEHVGPTSTHTNLPGTPTAYYPQPAVNGAAEQWKQQILSLKSYISSTRAQIANLEQSVHYAGGNCVANCVQWNERQQQKQQQAEAMKQQLDQMQKRLEELQEMARRQGFGSSIYDP